MNYLKQAEGFYPIYLKAHSKPWTRRFHMLGNIMTIWFIIFCLLKAFVNPFFLFYLLLTPFIIYPFAWGSHALIEKNKPATFYVSPIITKLCDLKMMIDMLKGNIKL